MSRRQLSSLGKIPPVNGWCPRNGWRTATPLRRSAPWRLRTPRIAAETVASYLAALRLTRQAAQPVYLELRCEAGDLMPRLARVAGPYGVTVFSGGGMDALKPKKEAGERAAGREVPTIIGHIADLDLSGGNIADAFAEDALAWAAWHREHGEPGSLSIVRLALTREQAAAHDLLDAEGKAEVDARAGPRCDGPRVH